jgi:septal ring factor EnvC (AmiA/AmiB activator)
VPGVVAVSNSNNEKITFRVDGDTKRRLESGHVNKSAVMRDLAEKYSRTGDTAEAALLVEREQKEDRLREVRRDISDLEAEADKIERALDRIDRRLEQRRENTSEEAKDLAGEVSAGRFPRDNLTEENLAVQNKAGKAGLEVSEFLFEVREELDQ